MEEQPKLLTKVRKGTEKKMGMVRKMEEVTRKKEEEERERGGRRTCSDGSSQGAFVSRASHNAEVFIVFELPLDRSFLHKSKDEREEEEGEGMVEHKCDKEKGKRRWKRGTWECRAASSH